MAAKRAVQARSDAPSAPPTRARVPFGVGTDGEVDTEGDCVLCLDLINCPNTVSRRLNVSGTLGQSPLPMGHPFPAITAFAAFSCSYEGAPCGTKAPRVETLGVCRICQFRDRAMKRGAKRGQDYSLGC